MPKLIRNSAKPIKGAIASAITYVALKVGLDVDPAVAFAVSTAIYAAVVRVVYPIFGLRSPTPEVR